MATILITSGGTKVYIDEVRHVGNMSSGRFGADLAREALRLGHTVIFLYATVAAEKDFRWGMWKLDGERPTGMIDPTSFLKGML